MKFYVASGLENYAAAREVAEGLKAMGHEHTYDWTQHGSVQEEGPERITEVAVNETLGVIEADLFVALLPGARGTHTEFGIALAMGMGVGNNRHVFVVGPTEDANGRTCAFYMHPKVKRFDTPVEFLAYMRGVGEAEKFLPPVREGRRFG